jgi:SulP family sulfate permease
MPKNKSSSTQSQLSSSASLHELAVPTKQIVLDTVLHTYQRLEKQLRDHLAIEISSSSQPHDFAHFTKYYYTLLSELEKKLKSWPVSEYNSLIRQANYHLVNVYHNEIDAYMNKVKQEHTLMKLESVFHECDLPQIEKMELLYDPTKENELFHTIEEIDQFAHSWPSEHLVERHTEEDLILFDPWNEDQDIFEKREFQKRPMYVRIFRFISKFLPFLVWLPEYRHHLSDLKSDILAGLTVGILIIPQGMAYAMIAGLPPVHGMYAALAPLFVYSFLGTSRQLAVGPTAMCSLILSSELNKLFVGMEMDTPLYILYAMCVTFLMGLTQILMGLLRLGFLVNFLSFPVISGFTSAVALQIICSQLSNFTGVPMPTESQLHKIIRNFGKGIHALHFPTTLMGIISFIFMYFMTNFYFELPKPIKFKIWRKEFTISKRLTLLRIPASLVLVLSGILVMYLVKIITGYDSSHKEVFGIKILGPVPPGPPRPGLPIVPGFSFNTIQKLSTAFLTLALVGFVEIISIGKFYSIQKGYQVDPNQELIAIGMSNLLGSFFRAFPCSGSAARSAVNANSGAITPLAGFISASLILFAITLLTPLFYYLPMSVLAGIIIYSCSKLIDFKQVIFTFKTKKRDCIVLLLAFFCSLFIGIKEGVLIAAGASLIVFILRSSRPRFHIIGRKPGTTQYLEVQRWKDCKEIPGILVMRFDSDMYFANVGFFTEHVHRAIRKSPYPVYALVLDCSGTNQADSTAVQTMIEMKKSLDTQGIELYIAQMKRSMRVVMKRGGIYGVIDKKEHFFENLHDAVLHAESITRTRRMEELQKQHHDSTDDDPVTSNSSIHAIDESEENEHTYLRLSPPTSITTSYSTNS